MKEASSRVATYLTYIIQGSNCNFDDFSRSLNFWSGDFGQDFMTQHNMEFKDMYILSMMKLRGKLSKTGLKNDIQQYRAVVVRDSSRELPALTRRIIDKQPRLTVPTLEQKIGCQIAGLGVGYLPRHRISEELKNDKLRLLTVLEEQPQTPLHLIWKKSNQGKALRWFVNELQGFFKIKKNG
jgi:hypothetical protein